MWPKYLGIIHRLLNNVHSILFDSLTFFKFTHVLSSPFHVYDRDDICLNAFCISFVYFFFSFSPLPMRWIRALDYHNLKQNLWSISEQGKLSMLAFMIADRFHTPVWRMEWYQPLVYAYTVNVKVFQSLLHSTYSCLSWSLINVNGMKIRFDSSYDPVRAEKPCHRDREIENSVFVEWKICLKLFPSIWLILRNELWLKIDH